MNKILPILCLLVGVMSQQRSLLTDLSGTYQGSKDVFGQHVTVNLEFHSVNSVTVTVDSSKYKDTCPNEAITLSGNVITLVNGMNSGDCVHDNLQKQGVSVNSVTHDAGADTVTLTVNIMNFKFPVQMVLNHQG